MCESDMVAHPRAEAQVQYRNCAESALTIHVYFTHCASARGRALQKNKVRLGIHLRREWDCTFNGLCLFIVCVILTPDTPQVRYTGTQAWCVADTNRGDGTRTIISQKLLIF